MGLKTHLHLEPHIVVLCCLLLLPLPLTVNGTIYLSSLNLKRKEKVSELMTQKKEEKYLGLNNSLNCRLGPFHGG